MGIGTGVWVTLTHTRPENNTFTTILGLYAGEHTVHRHDTVRHTNTLLTTVHATVALSVRRTLVNYPLECRKLSSIRARAHERTREKRVRANFHFLILQQPILNTHSLSVSGHHTTMYAILCKRVDESAFVYLCISYYLSACVCFCVYSLHVERSVPECQCRCLMCSRRSIGGRFPYANL